MTKRTTLHLLILSVFLIDSLTTTLSQVLDEKFIYANHAPDNSKLGINNQDQPSETYSQSPGSNPNPDPDPNQDPRRNQFLNKNQGIRGSNQKPVKYPIYQGMVINGVFKNLGIQDSNQKPGPIENLNFGELRVVHECIPDCIRGDESPLKTGVPCMCAPGAFLRGCSLAFCKPEQRRHHFYICICAHNSQPDMCVSSRCNNPTDAACRKSCDCTSLPKQCSKESFNLTNYYSRPCACKWNSWFKGCIISPCTSDDDESRSSPEAPYHCECTPEFSPSYCIASDCNKNKVSNQNQESKYFGYFKPDDNPIGLKKFKIDENEPFESQNYDINPFELMAPSPNLTKPSISNPVYIINEYTNPLIYQKPEVSDLSQLPKDNLGLGPDNILQECIPECKKGGKLPLKTGVPCLCAPGAVLDGCRLAFCKPGQPLHEDYVCICAPDAKPVNCVSTRCANGTNPACTKTCDCAPVPPDCTPESKNPADGGEPCGCTEENWKMGCSIRPCTSLERGPDDTYHCQCTFDIFPSFCFTSPCKT